MRFTPHRATGAADSSALCVRVARVAEHGSRVWAHLDDAAEVHDRNPVGDVLDHLEVVADEEVGEVQLLLDVEQEVEDLAAHGHVEGRRRLVEDHHVGLGGDGAGDADTLPLPAAQLVRIAVEMGVASARPSRAAP